MSLFAARYAHAFADVAASASLDAATVDRQLSEFLAVWDESAQLREVFADPSVPAAQKVAVLDSMNRTLNMLPQVRNLFAVLIDHNRIVAVQDVVAEYRAESRRRRGISQAEIVTAREMNAADKSTLLAHVAELAHGQVEASFKLDPAILGGVVVRLGSTVYDGSVLGRVERLKEVLMNG